MTVEIQTPLVEELKGIMNALPVPLTIVTAAFKGQKRGVTISSFTCHSMNPPLITFNIDRETQFCEIIRNTSHFVVHFPSQKHVELCQRFARKGLSSGEQFSGIDFFENEYGSPVIKGVPSAIYCTKEDIIEVGDHFILVGHVLNALKSGEAPGLLYHHKTFITLESEKDEGNRVLYREMVAPKHLINRGVR